MTGGAGSVGTLSHLAPIVHGATKQATDPGSLRRALAGRCLARAYLTGGWTEEHLWSVAEHLGLSRADVYRGARWTAEQTADAYRRLWPRKPRKLSDPSEMVTP